MSLDFSICDVELERAKKFIEEHNAKHGSYAGAIGGRYSYTFTRTSIGEVITVKCGSCGEFIDVTDYDSW